MPVLYDDVQMDQLPAKNTTILKFLWSVVTIKIYD